MPNPNNAVTLPYLATFFVDNSANWSQTFVAVGAIIDMIDPPKPKRGSGKTSGLSNTSQTHTFKPGWIDPGEVKFSSKFNKNDFSALFTYFMTDADPRYWKIRYNDGSTPTSGSTELFLGFITDLGNKQFDAETEDPIVTEVTIKLSGPETFTSAT